MITADQIPDEVVKVAANAFYNATGPTIRDDWREAIAAALNAWQRAFVKFSRPDDCETLCLPLPQEPSDD